MDESSLPSRPVPVREDCWSEEATSTLIDAWERRYLELSRGNLRQKDWQDVADAVNARHGHSQKTIRTDVQCKNRIDTIKKKYKSEKARVSASDGVLVSNWRFYDRLDALIGPNVNKVTTAAAACGGGGGSQIGVSVPPLVNRKSGQTPPVLNFIPVVLPKKRGAPADDSYFRRNYSAVAAAAAAAAAGEEDEDDEAEGRTEEDEDAEGSRSSRERDEEGNGDADGDGIKMLAMAIRRFGEVYVKVEGEKQRQMVVLEKQRMQFAKELEVQRMQMFMNTQVQLEKIKRSKGSGSNGIADIYS